MGATHRQQYSKKITVSEWAPSTRASSCPPLRDSQSMRVFIKRELKFQKFMRIFSDGKITVMHRPKWIIAFKTEQLKKQIKKYQCSTNSQMYHKEQTFILRYKSPIYNVLSHVCVYNHFTIDCGSKFTVRTTSFIAKYTCRRKYLTTDHF